jgi:hypothetical protein
MHTHCHQYKIWLKPLCFHLRGLTRSLRGKFGIGSARAAIATAATSATAANAGIAATIAIVAATAVTATTANTANTAATATITAAIVATSCYCRYWSYLPLLPLLSPATATIAATGTTAVTGTYYCCYCRYCRCCRYIYYCRQKTTLVRPPNRARIHRYGVQYVVSQCIWDFTATSENNHSLTTKQILESIDLGFNIWCLMYLRISGYVRKQSS